MALAAPAAPVDTSPPGTTRRRVWQTPAVRSHSLLALTLTKLYLAPAGPPPKPETVSAILNGANLDDAFGPFGLSIDLPAVSRVTLDLTANSLAIEYDPTRGRPGSGVVGRKPRAEAVIAFADHATADEVYTKLWRRLGERFVLKPNDDYGGHGITLGWTVDAATWEKAVQHALSTPYVVQEKVGLPREVYPGFEGGTLQFIDRMLDTNPFIGPSGCMDGCLTRISTEALLNVTAGGGSTVPTVVVDGR